MPGLRARQPCRRPAPDWTIYSLGTGWDRWPGPASARFVWVVGSVGSSAVCLPLGDGRGVSCVRAGQLWWLVAGVGVVCEWGVGGGSWFGRGGGLTGPAARPPGRGARGSRRGSLPGRGPGGPHPYGSVPAATGGPGADCCPPAPPGPARLAGLGERGADARWRSAPGVQPRVRAAIGVASCSPWHRAGAAMAAGAITVAPTPTARSARSACTPAELQRQKVELPGRRAVLPEQPPRAERAQRAAGCARSVVNTPQRQHRARGQDLQAPEHLVLTRFSPGGEVASWTAPPPSPCSRSAPTRAASTELTRFGGVPGRHMPARAMAMSRCASGPRDQGLDGLVQGHPSVVSS